MLDYFYKQLEQIYGSELINKSKKALGAVDNKDAKELILCLSSLTSQMPMDISLFSLNFVAMDISRQALELTSKESAF